LARELTEPLQGILPWLPLAGALAFAFGGWRGEVLRQRARIGPGVVIGAQALLSIYAGYFDGGVSIMMMAVWSLLGKADINVTSVGRAVLVSAANAVAVLCFAIAGRVCWPETAVMLTAALIGGYFGAVLARRVPGPWLRGFSTVAKFADLRR
jgi:uncharacterized protein